MIERFLQVYQSNWVNSDSPCASSAFLCGMEAAIELFSEALSDSPQSYEDAKSKEQWAEYLTELVHDANRKIEREEAPSNSHY